MLLYDVAWSQTDFENLLVEENSITFITTLNTNQLTSIETKTKSASRQTQSGRKMYVMNKKATNSTDFINISNQLVLAIINNIW